MITSRQLHTPFRAREHCSSATPSDRLCIRYSTFPNGDVVAEPIVSGKAATTSRISATIVALARWRDTMVTKYRVVAAAALVAFFAVSAVAAQASTSRHELESEYHGNTH